MFIQDLNSIPDSDSFVSMENIQIDKHDYGFNGYGDGAIIDKEPQVNTMLSDLVNLFTFFSYIHPLLTLKIVLYSRCQ